jgi:[ribosomal protein S5]-alanine N-acetyltransferase
MSLRLVDDIATSRLSLICLTPEMLRSEQAGEGRLGELIRCVVPTNWPHENWEPHVYDFMLTQLAEYPEQLGWHRYVGLISPDGSRTLVGSLGAFTKAGHPSECEIGYGMLPQFERQGFATEGAKALIEYLRGDERIESVIAHTFPSIPASIRVMEKCGMVFDGDGEEAGTVRYRLALRPTADGRGVVEEEQREAKTKYRDPSLRSG